MTLFCLNSRMQQLHEKGFLIPFAFPSFWHLLQDRFFLLCWHVIQYKNNLKISKKATKGTPPEKTKGKIKFVFEIRFKLNSQSSWTKVESNSMMKIRPQVFTPFKNSHVYIYCLPLDARIINPLCACTFFRQNVYNIDWVNAFSGHGSTWYGTIKHTERSKNVPEQMTQSWPLNLHLKVIFHSLNDAIQGDKKHYRGSSALR